MGVNSLEALSAAIPEEAARWRELVLHEKVSDVYYQPEYVLANSEIERTDAIGLIFKEQSSGFLVPLLVRNIENPTSSPEIQWRDAYTPYGYGSLLPLEQIHLVDAIPLQKFFEQLDSWCKESDIVCCVLRLHPLMHQEEWFIANNMLSSSLRMHMRGSTTAINLQEWDVEHNRPLGIRKGRKSDLNVARRSLRVSWTSGADRDIEQNLHHFQTLYKQTMDGRDADGFYKFPAPYFSRLASLGDQFAVALALLDDEPVGGCIFLKGRDYAHYHLAAANEIGIKYRAGTLLVVEGSRWAREQGCKLLHLGGGLRPGDSLEDFKFSFGGQSYHYAYLVFVADPERFDQICRLPDAPWPYNIDRAPQMENK